MARLGKGKVLDLEELESQLGANRFPEFIDRCERDFQEQVQGILEKAAYNPRLKMVFLSGPTSSGKTTFARRFVDGLAKLGRPCKQISIDDYYLARATQYDEQGRPDYESESALDLALLTQHLQELSEGKTVRLPTFDFKTRTRVYEQDCDYTLPENTILLIEGLHALADRLAPHLEDEERLFLFIMPNATLYQDSMMLGRSDLRKLRRICRDTFHRSTSALATLDFWPIIAKTEDQIIMPYLAKADYYINSALPYAYCILAPIAYKQLGLSLEQYHKGDLAPSPNVRPGLFYADLNSAIKDATRLYHCCENIPMVSADLVPQDSILQEFIGS